MKKKSLIVLGLMSTLTLGTSLASLTSCNSKGDDTIHFWHTFGKEIQTVLQSKISSFTKLIKEQEGVDISISLEYQGGYDDIVSKVTKSFTSGDTPTIAVAYPDHVATYLDNSGNRDYVVKLDDFINDSEVGIGKETYLEPNGLGKDDFVDVFMEEGQNYIKEGTYSLPLMKSTEMMLYNKDIVTQVLQDMGLQVNIETYMKNLTWDQFMAIIDYANEHKSSYWQESSEVKYDDIKMLFYDSDSNLFISQCYQRNIPFISMENGVGSIDFVNDEAKDMVKELKTMYDAGKLFTKGTNKGEYGSDYFTSNKCLFVVGSTGGTGYNDPGENFNVGVCKFPVYKTAENTDYARYVSQGVTLTLLNNYGISSDKNDTKVKYAWKFLKYITNTENNIDICLSSQGYIPVRESAYTNEDYRSYLNETDFMSVCAKMVIDEIDGAYFNYPVFKGSDAARDYVGSIVTDYLKGAQEDLDVAFETALNNTKLKM